ncbi:MAG: HD-GYP domain-containing protein [Lachnotalea sp.]
MIKMVDIKSLKEGMVVARDIYTPSEGLIVANMTVLTTRGITRLGLYNLKVIPIKFEDVEAKESKVEEKEAANYTSSEKMKHSENFKQFNKSFGESLKVAEKVIDEIAIRDGDVNVKLINTMVDRVVDVSNNGIYVFDMLHCMRELDDLTYAHSMSVSLICKIFGDWLHMSEEDCQQLKIAGFLHDIGKVKIPKEILTKKDKLTRIEYEIMKKHTEFGYDILKNKNLDERIKLATLMHHEKCDGTGYPNKLKGNQIDDFAKIIAIADAYEAMTSTRCYREALSPFTVIEYFESNSLKHFEPKFIIPLMEMLVQSYIGNHVKLSNGVVGEVIMINRNDLSRPIVKTGTECIDLSNNKSIKIVSVI